MPTYDMGKLIRKLRIQKGITQEELCDGICTVIALSRVENGSQVFHRRNFDAIMQRLGENAENYMSVFISAKDFEVFQKRQALKQCLINLRYDEVPAMITALKNDENFNKEKLNRQFLLFAEASEMHERKTGTGENDEWEEIMKILNEAICISISNYKEANIHLYLLTYEEILIIDLIALIYFQMDQKNKAIELLYQLKTSMDNSYMDQEEIARAYTMVLYNLSKYLGLTGKHKEVIEICDIAAKACIEYNKLSILPYILFNKAYGLNLSGDKIPCERLLYQSYYGFDMMGNFQLADMVKNYAKDEHGIVF